MGLKADKTYVDNGITGVYSAMESDKRDVNNFLYGSLKHGITGVYSAMGLKADKTYVDNIINESLNQDSITFFEKNGANTQTPGGSVKTYDPRSVKGFLITSKTGDPQLKNTVPGIYIFNNTNTTVASYKPPKPVVELVTGNINGTDGNFTGNVSGVKGAFSDVVSGNSVVLNNNNNTVGYASIKQGTENVNDSGFIEFNYKDGKRKGYIGSDDSKNNISLTTENGCQGFRISSKEPANANLIVDNKICIGNTCFTESDISLTLIANRVSTQYPGYSLETGTKFITSGKIQLSWTGPLEVLRLDGYGLFEGGVFFIRSELGNYTVVKCLYNPGVPTWGIKSYYTGTVLKQTTANTNNQTGNEKINVLISNDGSITATSTSTTPNCTWFLTRI
jgi:hypothetical protein